MPEFMINLRAACLKLREQQSGTYQCKKEPESVKESTRSYQENYQQSMSGQSRMYAWPLDWVTTSYWQLLKDRFFGIDFILYLRPVFLMSTESVLAIASNTFFISKAQGMLRLNWVLNEASWIYFRLLYYLSGSAFVNRPLHAVLSIWGLIAVILKLKLLKIIVQEYLLTNRAIWMIVTVGQKLRNCHSP